MDKKKVNVADILINNGIIILIFLMVIFVGVTKENFFSGSNFSNVSINVACRFIIAVGVSGCLITKGTDLSAGRVVGLAACLAGSESRLQRTFRTYQEFPPAQCMGDSLNLYCHLLYLRSYQRYCYIIFKRTGLHRHSGYADDRIRN